MTDPKRISSGLSLPVWMKRVDTRYDVEGAYSPPAHDESFFYIRYPVSAKNNDNSSTELNKLHSALQNSDSNVKTTATEEKLSITTTTKHVDFSKHTESCRKYIDDKISPSVSKGITKSQGTDDGFGKACGNSILKVAQQIVSGRQLVREGVTVANFDEANVEPEDTLRDSEDSKMSYSARSMMRRGSKSLPASPTGSPKTQRKVAYNPYFTTYAPPAKNENRSWFLTSLFGVPRDTLSATSTNSIGSQIDEEVEEVYESNNNNTTSNNYKYNINTDTDTLSKKQTNVLRAKPSELREMNFWSPTSM